MKILFLLVLISICLCGCSSLDYTGSDYKQSNVQNTKTQEEFVFNTYKKTLGNINVKIGISRTPVTEILALYVKIENLSNSPYVFRVEDLKVSNPLGDVKFITSNNYLSIYQAQEASSMNAMSVMGATLTNMTGMSANFNDYNQTIAQNASQESSKTAFSKIEQLGNQILKHSIRVSSTISPQRSQYYYFFFEDTDKFPIEVNYKSLKYQFNL